MQNRLFVLIVGGIGALLLWGCGSSSINDDEIDQLISSSSSSTWSGTKQLGTSSGDYAYGVAVDSSGNVYAAGSTDGGLDGNSNAGGTDLFVVKYNSSGVKQ